MLRSYFFTKNYYFRLVQGNNSFEVWQDGQLIGTISATACDLEESNIIYWGDNMAISPRAAAIHLIDSKNDGITFTVPGQPVPAPRMTRGAIFTKNHRNRKYIDAYLAHKDAIGWAAKSANVPLLEGPVEMHVTFYVKDRRRRDSKNMLATAEDGLAKIGFNDDSQIVRHIIEKHLDRENPRTVITLIPLNDSEWVY